LLPTQGATAMRARWLAMGLLAVATTGCGGGSFKDAEEELRYLQSISNPTPEQFRRREQLPKEIKTAKILEQRKTIRATLDGAKKREDEFKLGEAKDAYQVVSDLLKDETDSSLRELHSEAEAGLARIRKIRPD
jgi:hypothetical protein